MAKNRVLGIRVSDETLKYLKFKATTETLSRGTSVSHVDLVRELIHEAYPVPENFDLVGATTVFASGYYFKSNKGNEK